MEANEADNGNAQALLAASQAELTTAKTLVGIAGSLSLLGSVLMLVCFLLFQDSRRGGRRVLFCLHLADAGASVAWLLTLALPESPRETEPLCYVQVSVE